MFERYLSRKKHTFFSPIVFVKIGNPRKLPHCAGAVLSFRTVYIGITLEKLINFCRSVQDPSRSSFKNRPAKWMAHGGRRIVAGIIQQLRGHNFTFF